MKKNYRFVTVLALGSALLLTACHKEAKSVAKSTGTSSQVTQNAKQSGKTSSTRDSQTVGKDGDNQGDVNVEKGASQDVSNQAQAGNNSQEASTMDVSAIANGDFSSVAGTWQNANGDTLVFDSQGLVSDIQYIESQGVSGEKAVFTIGNRDAATGSAALFMIPKGKASLSGTTFSEDVITVGQGENADNTPYYRVD